MLYDTMIWSPKGHAILLNKLGTFSGNELQNGRTMNVAKMWKSACRFHIFDWRYVTILEIIENATPLFSISFQHGLVDRNFVFIRQLYFTYSIKRSVFVLIDCQHSLFKSTCSKTSYLTPCNVPHEWFVFLHRALLADRVDYIFPTSKFRCVFSISKHSKIKSLKIVNNFRAGGSGKSEGRYMPCLWTFTPFRLYLALI